MLVIAEDWLESKVREAKEVLKQAGLEDKAEFTSLFVLINLFKKKQLEVKLNSETVTLEVNNAVAYSSARFSEGR